MKCYCPRDLTFPWQPYFNRRIFQNCNFPYFKIKQQLSCSVFQSLDHFMVFFFVSITFDSILDDFLRFRTDPEMLDGGPRWSPFKNDCAVITS